MASTTLSTRKKKGSDLRSFFAPSTTPESSSSTISSRKRNRPTGSAFQPCPLCDRRFPWHTLESHAATCQGPVAAGSSERKNSKITTLQTKAANSHVRSVVSAMQSSTASTIERIIAPLVNGGIQRTSDVAKNLALDVENQGGNTSINPYAKKKKTAPKMTQYAPSDSSSSSSKCSMPLPGLHLFEDFLTEEEEKLILATLDDPDHSDYLPWKPSNFNGKHFGKRYGVHCNLRTRSVTPPEHSMPWFVQAIIMPKLHAMNLSLLTQHHWVPNEVNSIDYYRRQGHVLKNHIDDRQLSKEPIVNLSLAGDCYMTFRNERKNSTGTSGSPNATGEKALPQEKRVLLKRKCLQVLTGKARYDYSHGIRNADLLSDRRVSLTMRESPLTASSSKKGDTQSTSKGQPTLRDIFGKAHSNVD